MELNNFDRILVGVVCIHVLPTELKSFVLGIGIS